MVLDIILIMFMFIVPAFGGLIYTYVKELSIFNNFQTEILVACIQSPMFINKIGLLIESKFFENSSFSIIHSGIKK